MDSIGFNIDSRAKSNALSVAHVDEVQFQTSVYGVLVQRFKLGG